MRILVTGASGSIGKKICQFFRQVGYIVVPVDMIKGINIIQADLRKESSVVTLLSVYKPDIILHLAAIKDILFCEENYELANKTNYGVTETLTSLCVKSNIRLIYFSTDYVFDNDKKSWKEKDKTCPTTNYGKDKAASELLITKKMNNYAIIRTAQLYGFSGDFVSLVYHKLKAGQKFDAYANLVNCPTWIGDLCLMLERIIKQNKKGVFHCVGPSALSRYQFACKIAKVLKLNSSKIRSVELDSSVDVRPSIVKLDGTFTYKTLNVFPKKLEEVLPICISYTKGKKDVVS